MSQATPVLEYTSAASKPRVRTRRIFMIQAIQIPCIFAIPITLCFKEPSITWIALPLALATCILISGLQWLMLLPILEPRIDRSIRKPWHHVLSASVLGVFLGIFVFSIVGMISDIIWICGGSGTSPAGPAPDFPYMNEPALWFTLLVGLAAFFVSWMFMTPLLYYFMKGRTPEKALFQIASTIFLGTIVEALSSIGILVMLGKRGSCVCATFSFLTLVTSFAIGFLVFGPAILLLVLWRKSRYRLGGLCPACSYQLQSYEDHSRCPQCQTGWKPDPTPPESTLLKNV